MFAASLRRGAIVCLTFGAWPAALDEQGGLQPSAAAEPVEEVVVTAPVVTEPGPEPGEMPSGAFIVQVYDARHRGAMLYRQGRYREAVPFLLAASKRGFKLSQARLADIYLHGRGGVPRDLEAAVGWLGVAAEPKSDGYIRRYYNEVLGELPPAWSTDVEEVVADYRSMYGSHAHRVKCARSGGSSLRIKKLRCRFIDEATQCRTFETIDGPMEGGVATGIAEMGWSWRCPRPAGSPPPTDVR